MFKKSLLLSLSIVLLVFTSAFTTQMVLDRNLPSRFDNGLTIQEAFSTAETPLLVEFYTDSCTTCRTVTPMVHDLMKGPYHDQLTLVMLDLENPDNLDVAELFGVEELPGLYVFDFKRMKKFKIDSDAFASRATLETALDQALKTTSAL